MQLQFKGIKDSSLSLMRRAGYHFVRLDEKTKEEEYQRRVSGGNYPRFHAFLKADRGSISMNLHLDQKKPSYEGCSSHSGEYEDSEILEKEAEMLKRVFSS